MRAKVQQVSECNIVGRPFGLGRKIRLVCNLDTNHSGDHDNGFIQWPNVRPPQCWHCGQDSVGVVGNVLFNMDAHVCAQCKDRYPADRFEPLMHSAGSSHKSEGVGNGN